MIFYYFAVTCFLYEYWIQFHLKHAKQGDDCESMKLAIAYMFICVGIFHLFDPVIFSLGARYGFIQPIFYKRFDHFGFLVRQNGLKAQWSAVTSLGE